MVSNKKLCYELDEAFMVNPRGPIASPVIDIGDEEAKYFAFDDERYIRGEFKVIAQGNSLDSVIADARKQRKRFRMFQYNPKF